MNFWRPIKDFFSSYSERLDMEPCPFCKGRRLRVSDWIECEACRATGPSSYGKGDAIDNWNGVGEYCFDGRFKRIRRITTELRGGRNRQLAVPLLECPFCEQEEKEKLLDLSINKTDDGQYFVECWDCRCEGPKGTTREEASKLWNVDEE